MTEHALNTLDELQKQYDTADLHPVERKQIVNDDEVDEETYWLLNENFWIWPWVFWGIWIFSILFVGVMDK